MITVNIIHIYPLIFIHFRPRKCYQDFWIFSLIFQSKRTWRERIHVLTLWFSPSISIWDINQNTCDANSVSSLSRQHSHTHQHHSSLLQEAQRCHCTLTTLGSQKTLGSAHLFLPTPFWSFKEKVEIIPSVPCLLWPQPPIRTRMSPRCLPLSLSARF